MKQHHFSNIKSHYKKIRSQYHRMKTKVIYQTLKTVSIAVENKQTESTVAYQRLHLTVQKGNLANFTEHLTTSGKHNPGQHCGKDGKVPCQSGGIKKQFPKLREIKNMRQFEDRKGRQKKREIKEQRSRCFKSYFNINMLSVVLCKVCESYDFNFQGRLSQTVICWIFSQLMFTQCKALKN